MVLFQLIATGCTCLLVMARFGPEVSADACDPSSDSCDAHASTHGSHSVLQVRAHKGPSLIEANASNPRVFNASHLGVEVPEVQHYDHAEHLASLGSESDLELDELQTGADLDLDDDLLLLLLHDVADGMETASVPSVEG
jgi:hypothetical protein